MIIHANPMIESSKNEYMARFNNVCSRDRTWHVAARTLRTNPGEMRKICPQLDGPKSGLFPNTLKRTNEVGLQEKCHYGGDGETTPISFYGIPFTLSRNKSSHVSSIS